MKPDLLTFNWFDLITLAMIGVGIFVGRKRGMSAELLPMMQWLLIVVLSAMACDPLGRSLADLSGFNPVFCYVSAYLLTAAGIKLTFFLIKRAAGEKLLGSDTFGSLEYYLGMAGGAVRFGCITVFILALLYAKPVDDQALDKQIKDQNEVLGAIYFPPFGSIQNTIFKDSFSGRMAKEHLSAQLIQVDARAGSRYRPNNIGKAREREVYDIIGTQR